MKIQYVFYKLITIECFCSYILVIPVYIEYYDFYLHFFDSYWSWQLFICMFVIFISSNLKPVGLCIFINWDILSLCHWFTEIIYVFWCICLLDMLMIIFMSLYFLVTYLNCIFLWEVLNFDGLFFIWWWLFYVLY